MRVNADKFSIKNDEISSNKQNAIQNFDLLFWYYITTLQWWLYIDWVYLYLSKLIIDMCVCLVFSFLTENSKYLSSYIESFNVVFFYSPLPSLYIWIILKREKPWRLSTFTDYSGTYSLAEIFFSD